MAIILWYSSFLQFILLKNPSQTGWECDSSGWHRPYPIFGSTKPSIVLYCIVGTGIIFKYNFSIQIAFNLNQLNIN